MEDVRHLDLVEEIRRELESILFEYNRRANGITDKVTLVALRLEELDALEESIRKNRRVLRHMRGEQVEPEHHEARAVLKGIGASFAR